jgi:hypothetical protein
VGVIPNTGDGVIEVRAEAFGGGGVHRAVQVTFAREQGAPGPLVSGAREVRSLAWRQRR